MLEPNIASHQIDVSAYNRAVWDRQALEACEWSQPVSSEVVAAARAGQWSVKLTPGIRFQTFISRMLDQFGTSVHVY